MLQRLDSVPSTQDVLHRLAAEGAAAGTAVVAVEQTAGRGSRGRDWRSPAGGLWLSVLLRPASEPAVELLSLRVALAVAAALAPLAPVRIKWPNDLMLLDRKLGGILCEARWQGPALGWVAVGLGLNVANPIPPGLADLAIALRAVVPAAEPAALAEPLARAITEAARPGGALTGPELEAYKARDWLLGRRLDQPARGMALGIAADGGLRVRGPDGTEARVRSGSVVLASVAP
jgi:BirA family transcriptional regulator, biotin operon repressor / biotin---[acetyl-CoA-carboxylase] ligase